MAILVENSQGEKVMYMAVGEVARIMRRLTWLKEENQGMDLKTEVHV